LRTSPPPHKPSDRQYSKIIVNFRTEAAIFCGC
jgi:hypothetical protein